MKALIVTSRPVFPVHGGDKFRVHGLSQALKDFGYQVDCFYTDFGNSHCDIEQDLFAKYICFELGHLRALANAVFALFRFRPLQSRLYYSSALKSEVERVEAEYDVIVIHLVRMAFVGTGLKNKSKVWLDYTDSISMNYSRINLFSGNFSLMNFVYKIERRPLYNYEVFLSGVYGVNTVISDVDRKHLARGGAKKLFVLKNGVSVVGQKNLSSFGSKKIIFIGNMASKQNQDACLWFADNVMPLLESKGYIFHVIGKSPASFLKCLDRYRSVEATGEVDSISEYCKDTLVGVCPMRFGAGLQNKILSYLSMGIPTLSTSISATPIDPNGEVLTVCDSAQDFASSVIELAGNMEVYNWVSKSSFDFVDKNFSWATVIKDSEILEKINCSKSQ